MASFADHLFADDPAFGAPATWTAKQDAAGHFEVGTNPDMIIARLADPLDWLNGEGVAAIQAKRRPMMQRLIEELPKLGYPCYSTTAETGIVSFGVKDGGVQARLAEHKVYVTFMGKAMMRVSPSVYNSMGDVEKLLETLRG